MCEEGGAIYYAENVETVWNKALFKTRQYLFC